MLNQETDLEFTSRAVKSYLPNLPVCQRPSYFD